MQPGGSSSIKKYLARLSVGNRFTAPLLSAFFVATTFTLQACSLAATKTKENTPTNTTLQTNPVCANLLNEAMGATSLYAYQQALDILLSAKHKECSSQTELARVEQLASSVFSLTEDYESALNHLTNAIERNALDKDLQKQSIYGAAQLSYLLQRYDQGLNFITTLEGQTEYLQPNQAVLKARFLYALDRRQEALNIMINLFARHRSGEIVMKEEWIDFLRGMQTESNASLS